MARRNLRAADFSQPVRQLLLMVAALAATCAVGWLLLTQIETIFYANPWLNGLILAVFAIGVLASFAMVFRLMASVSWIEGFAAARPGHENAKPPALMASLAALLRDERTRRALSASSAQSILDSIASRLDESRDVTRYLGNLCIFLGLLGTFWGLSITVPAVVDTIRSLAPGAEGGAAATFERLMSGLEDQLGGMGTAFASSLLGLAGSLVIGLLELFAGHAQNRFHNELEEWLSSISHVGAAGEAVTPDLAAQLVGQNAIQIEALSKLQDQSEARRAGFEDRLAALTEQLSRLATQVEESQSPEARALTDRHVAATERLIGRLDENAGGDGPLGDAAEVRGRLRSIDLHLARMLEENASGRAESVQEMRGELARLTGAIARLVEER